MSGTAPTTRNQKVFFVGLFFNLMVPRAFSFSWSGVWRQADGTLLSWSPWWGAGKDQQGDPDGGKAENCAYVVLDESTYAGQWYDNPCTVAHHYVCERYWIKGFSNDDPVSQFECFVTIYVPVKQLQYTCKAKSIATKSWKCWIRIGIGIGMVIIGLGGSQQKTTVQGQPNGGKAETYAIVHLYDGDDTPCTAGYYI